MRSSREANDAKRGCTNDASLNGGLVVPYTSDFRDDRREFERRYIARCLEEVRRQRHARGFSFGHAPPVAAA